MRVVCLPMMVLLLPNAVITAAAFSVHLPGIRARLMITAHDHHHHHAINTRLPSPHLSILGVQSTPHEIDHDTSIIASQINQALEKRRQELLSDPAKLQPILQQHEISNDNDRVL